MKKLEKAVAKLRQNPKNVSFDEINKILRWFGFEKRQKGSHAVYTRKNTHTITIPFRRPHILPVYVKEVLKILDEILEELEDV